MRVGCVKNRTADRNADAAALLDFEWLEDGIMGLQMLKAGVPQPHNVRAAAPTIQHEPNGRCAR